MVQELYDEQLFREYVLNNKNIMTEHLTKETFISKIFNFETNKEWKFEGELPCIIDFYADWCGPCKMVAPILEELAEEYKDKLNIYKVDTEQETELASVFGIRSIPSLLFVPKNGQPQMAMGALPKESLVQAFKDVLEVEK
jgi:thioredoxin 1